MIYALAGFMGCGKSSVAQILAEKMQCFFFDLDDTIEMEEGRSISEIFENDGEAAFRKLELEYLRRILEDYEDFPTTMILSLGGGTLMTEECADLIRKHTTCYYLRLNVDELVSNLILSGTQHRPLVADARDLRERVVSLLAERASTYENTADVTLDIDGLSFEQIADRIFEMSE